MNKTNSRIQDIIDTLTNNVSYYHSYKSDSNCWYVATTLDNEDDMLIELSNLLDVSLGTVYDSMVVSESQLSHATDIDYDLSDVISNNFRELLEKNK